MQYRASTDINFSGDAYIPSANFDLAAVSVVDPGGIVYPIPLAFIVDSRHINTDASTKLSSSRIISASQVKRRIDLFSKHNAVKAPSKDSYATRQPWNRTPVKDRLDDEHALHQASVKQISAERQPWGKPFVIDDLNNGITQPWGQPPAKDFDTRSGYNIPPVKDTVDLHSFNSSAVCWQPSVSSEGALEQTNDGNFTLGGSAYLPPSSELADFELVPDYFHEEVTPTRPVDFLQCVGWGATNPTDFIIHHPWDMKPRLGTEMTFTYSSEPDPPTNNFDPVIIKPVYVHMNSSSLVDIATGTPLEFADLNIDADIDSFSWLMSCYILNDASMSLIKPTASGPAEVRATINGHEWVFIVERYSTDRRLSKTRYQIRGVSRTQLLAHPYAPRLTARIDAPLNITQAMNTQLQFTGFTIDYQTGLPDHAIPANAWGYEDKTPIEVITELAASVGAAIIPDKSIDKLFIKHRYKQIPPWTYPAGAADSIDAQIADAIVLSQSSAWSPSQLYNGIYVSGIQQGVTCNVIRTGTAGDLLAPDDYNALNVDTTQCRMKGMTILSGSGNHEIVSIETPLPTSGAPGLLEPAMLIEYADIVTPANTWHGMVLSNSISVSQPGASKVIQNVKIERHYY